MDTPELQQLYLRYQRYARLAKAYNCVLDDLTGDPLIHLIIDPVQKTLTPTLRLGMHVVSILKTIPRDRPSNWYVAKYIEYQTKADNAHKLYLALCDAHRKRAYEAMSREERLTRLREIGAGLAAIEDEIAGWRAKIPAWEREQVEREPTDPDKAVLQAYLDSFGDPRPIVATLEDLKREREAERDWLLEYL